MTFTAGWRSYLKLGSRALPLLLSLPAPAMLASTHEILGPAPISVRTGTSPRAVGVADFDLEFSIDNLVKGRHSPLHGGHGHSIAFLLWTFDPRTNRLRRNHLPRLANVDGRFDIPETNAYVAASANTVSAITVAIAATRKSGRENPCK
jgi:hypothetical protein